MTAQRAVRLSVSRLYTPISRSFEDPDCWEDRQFRVTVWVEGTGALDLDLAKYRYYIPGVLTPVVDGRPIPLCELDALLAEIGLTRVEVEQAINEKAGVK